MPTCLRKFNDHDGLQNICMFQIADLEFFLNNYKRVHNQKRKEKGLTCELVFFFPQFCDVAQVAIVHKYI
jgi:hypothetical protein